jgi:hypothetical protein
MSLVQLVSLNFAHLQPLLKKVEVKVKLGCKVLVDHFRILLAQNFSKANRTRFGVSSGFSVTGG